MRRRRKQEPSRESTWSGRIRQRQSVVCAVHLTVDVFLNLRLPRRHNKKSGIKAHTNGGEQGQHLTPEEQHVHSMTNNPLKLHVIRAPRTTWQVARAKRQAFADLRASHLPSSSFHDDRAQPQTPQSSSVHC